MCTQIISFYSYKKCIGTSTISYEISHALSNVKINNKNINVLYIDFNNILNYMNPNTYSIGLENNEINTNVLNKNLDNIYTLDENYFIDNNISILDLFNSLNNSNFDIVIFDLGFNYSQETIYVLRKSNLIYIINIAEYKYLSDNKFIFRMLNNFNLNIQNIKIILNKYQENCNINKEELEKLCIVPIISVLKLLNEEELNKYNNSFISDYESKIYFQFIYPIIKDVLKNKKGLMKINFKDSLM